MTKLLGLAIFVADLWAIWNILQSKSSMGAKILWTILVLVLPVVGLLVWFFMGPKK